MLTLFTACEACSLVPIVALEKAQVKYRINTIDLAGGEQYSPEFLRVNPKGQVPALHTPDGSITEIIGILFYLHKHYPAARILPRTMNFIDATCHLAWLVSHIHPLTTQYCRRKVTEREPDTGEELHRALSIIHERLKESTFWHDEDWNLLDVYLFWIVRQLKESSFDCSGLALLEEHQQRLASIPVICRSILKESLL
ncbi:glutathione S-transferase [Alteromonas sp. 1_MG-2023]|uniref:glutathione S-transferase family protein n=1 Tax=Alteromonas sp. 1_MG-2023 TaxID=3062669 RepID=UPI0026E158FC|nr:glutathione S-transferase [Alteromonas sp. 1_MG-2023]MDO6477307.1 glutathione S-transferase [Alteromonas sp. 1_MG-2023]